MSKVNYAAIDIGSNAVTITDQKYQIPRLTSAQLFTQRAPYYGFPCAWEKTLFPQGEIPARKG